MFLHLDDNNQEASGFIYDPRLVAHSFPPLIGLDNADSSTPKILVNNEKPPKEEENGACADSQSISSSTTTTTTTASRIRRINTPKMPTTTPIGVRTKAERIQAARVGLVLGVSTWLF